MYQLKTVFATLLVGLLSVGVGGCNSSPIATTTVAAPPAVAANSTAADSAAALSPAPASAQPVPFVGKPTLKAALRSGELAPAATSTR